MRCLRFPLAPPPRADTTWQHGTLPAFVLLADHEVMCCILAYYESLRCLCSGWDVHTGNPSTEMLLCCPQPYRLTHRHNEIWIMKADEERERA